MKIYTKTGDKGETSLFGGKRVPKDTLRIEAYGTVDELNSILGVCRSTNAASEVDAILNELQHDLFVLGADLATPKDGKEVTRISADDISRLERHIDDIEKKLIPLQSFILPGGNRSASMMHFARTISRRAERLVVRLQREEPIGELPVIYLNRLSDLLFVVARWINALGNTPETKWQS
ncbi:MAG TPA: cob(I)yrinic acid a,c-diamide adenosyltransferase [Bacteroidota bacterium]|nr:cob(I)yrinic acid a,c-diamide adenosyltransferase [Bacteroidota bacterium]